MSTVTTRPWGDDELLRVGIYPLTYTAHRTQGITAVHIPGGKQATLRAVMEKYPVHLPATLRYFTTGTQNGNETAAE